MNKNSDLPKKLRKVKTRRHIVMSKSIDIFVINFYTVRLLGIALDKVLTLIELLL